MPAGMGCNGLSRCVVGQYRGRLDVPSITRALCAGFSEAAEPDMCLSGSLQASLLCLWPMRGAECDASTCKH